MKGVQLKEIREASGLTQVQFAEKLGLHPISLSRFERDIEPITKIMELALCELERRLVVPGEKSKKKR